MEKKDNEKPIVSVIIPAYNAEKTIKRCINSISNQSLKEIEIIIVNDGSVDYTDGFCLELAQNDQRIKYIKKDNSGVSDTRNVGIVNAQGKYITFLDSDDYYSSNDFLCEAVSCMDKSELCIFNFDIYEKNIRRINTVNTAPGMINIDNFFNNLLKKPFDLYYGAVWNKIFITKIIKEKNILFNKEISLGEDFLFVINYLKYCQNIIVLNKSYIAYCIGSGSSLSTGYKKSIEKKINEISYRVLFNKELMCIVSDNNNEKNDSLKVSWMYLGRWYINQLFQVKYIYNWKDVDKQNYIGVLKKDKEIKRARESMPMIYKIFFYIEGYISYRTKPLIKMILKRIMTIIENVRV